MKIRNLVMGLFSVVLLLLVCVRCGQNPNNTGLTPTNTGNGYSVNIQRTVGNTFKFTVTQNKDFKGAVFSVYGFWDSNQMFNFDPNARVRLPHVVDGSDSFEVTFQPTDLYFAIFQDNVVNGSFVYSTSKLMVSGQLP